MSTSYQKTLGIDEAGRGPWAGPVVAAAVLLPNRFPRSILGDSKKLSAMQREHAFTMLSKKALIGVGIASVEEIDALNIKQATYLAMQRAVQHLPTVYTSIKVDGKDGFTFHVPTTSIVKGDETEAPISAASIVAKVFRDRMMHLYDALYPTYGFASHMGYGTTQHQDALAQYGPCPIHRRSYAPIKSLLDRGSHDFTV